MIYWSNAMPKVHSQFFEYLLEKIVSETKEMINSDSDSYSGTDIDSVFGRENIPSILNLILDCQKDERVFILSKHFYALIHHFLSVESDLINNDSNPEEYQLEKALAMSLWADDHSLVTPEKCYDQERNGIRYEVVHFDFDYFAQQYLHRINDETISSLPPLQEIDLLPTDMNSDEDDQRIDCGCTGSFKCHPEYYEVRCTDGNTLDICSNCFEQLERERTDLKAEFPENWEYGDPQIAIFQNTSDVLIEILSFRGENE